jgi:hypothetical protein
MWFARMAHTPRIVATTPKAMIMAMITNPTGKAAIEAADRRNDRTFTAYIWVLIVTALVVALFTYLTWDSGNKLQAAIASDTDARIAEANRRIAEADERAESEKLERIKIEERLAWRRITPEQHDVMVEILRPYAGTRAMVASLSPANGESKAFAAAIFEVFKDAGWQVPLVLGNTAPNPPTGVICRIDMSTSAGQALKVAMQGLPDVVFQSVKFDESLGNIIVGLRPPP